MSRERPNGRFDVWEFTVIDRRGSRRGSVISGRRLLIMLRNTLVVDSSFRSLSGSSVTVLNRSLYEGAFGANLVGVKSFSLPVTVFGIVTRYHGLRR